MRPGSVRIEPERFLMEHKGEVSRTFCTLLPRLGSSDSVRDASAGRLLGAVFHGEHQNPGSSEAIGATDGLLQKQGVEIFFERIPAA